jgi:hypothetical protein
MRSIGFISSAPDAPFLILDFIMAPQPLSRVKPDGPFVFGSSEALTADPKLGAAFAAAIGAWSYAESYYGFILASLLGAQAAPALAMMQVLTSTSAQDQALEAAAKTVLSVDDMPLFSAVMAVTRRHRNRRHCLAHGVIGHSSDIPRALLVADLRAFQLLTSNVFVARPLLVGPVDSKEFIREATREFSKSVFVYREDDLVERTKEFEKVATMLLNLTVLVSHVHHGKVQALEELLSLPEIQTELRRQQKNQKAPPKPLE